MVTFNLKNGYVLQFDNEEQRDDYIVVEFPNTITARRILRDRGIVTVEQNVEVAPQVDVETITIEKAIELAEASGIVVETETHEIVKKLSGFGSIASKVISDDETAGVPFVDIFLDSCFKLEELPTKYADNTEKVYAERCAATNDRNAKKIAKREEFKSEFGNKMGFIRPAVIYHDFHSKLLLAESPLLDVFAFQYRSEVTGMGDATGVVKYTKDESALKYSANENLPNEDGTMLWFSLLAYATRKFNSVDMARFIELIFTDCTVKGNIVAREDIAFNLGLGIVTSGARILECAKAVCLGKISDEFIVLEGKHALFMLCLELMNASRKQMLKKFNDAVALFKEDVTYGRIPKKDEITGIARDWTIYTAGLQRSTNMWHKFASFTFVGASQKPDFVKWILSKEIIATSDKQNVKYVIVGPGANALGLGWDEANDIIMNMNDSSKLSKLSNRPAANKYSAACSDERVASNFAFALEGNTHGVDRAHVYGIKKKVIWSNSLLTFGSGVAASNKSCEWSFTVPKKIRKNVPLSFFNVTEAQARNLPALILKKVEEAKGKLFAPGDVMVSLTDFRTNRGLVLVTNNEEVANLAVKSGEVKEVKVRKKDAKGFTKEVLDSFDIVLSVDIVATVRFVKTRRYGTKFTTLPYDVTIGNGWEWDILLNNECVKGNGALMELFCNAQGKTYVCHTSKGLLVADDGEVIDLKVADNKVAKWVHDNKETTVIEMNIARSHWETLKRFTEGGEVEVLETHDDYVRVRETVEAIKGELVFDVEIATALESVSKSSLTLESASAIMLQNRRLGVQLLEQCVTKAKKFTTLVKAHAGLDVPAKDHKPFNPFVTRARHGFARLICGMDATVADEDVMKVASEWVTNVAFAKDQQWLIQRVGKLCPTGINFVIGTTQVYLNYNVIALFGSFDMDNGCAIRETSKFYSLVIDLLMGAEVSYDTHLKDAFYSYKYIVDTKAVSKNVLKKPTRVGTLVYGKIRTSFHPLLNQSGDLPVIVLHVNDPILTLLNFDSKVLCARTKWGLIPRQLKIFGLVRTPMPFLGAFELRLTDDLTVCEPGHVLVDPYVFHALSEGDSR